LPRQLANTNCSDSTANSCPSAPEVEIGAGDRRGLPVAVDHPEYRPLSQLLADVHRRYQRPIFLAETGIEGDVRPAWLRVVGHEVAQARRAGVPVEGICLYPVTDYPGWEDDRHCPTGLLGYVDADGSRPVFEPLAHEIAIQARAPCSGVNHETEKEAAKAAAN